MSSGTFRIPAEPNRQRPRSPGTADASTSSGNGNSQQQSGANSSLLPLPPPLSPPQQQQQQHQQQGQQTQQHEPENANASLSRSSREPLTEVSGSQAQGSTSWSSSSHAGEGHDYSQELRDGMTEYRHPSKGKGVVGGGEGEGGQATQLPTQLDPTQVIGLDPTQVIGLDLTQLGDDDEEDQNDEGIPFATLIGQDGLADVILRDKMQEMTFGASHECDVQLRPRKLGLCPTGNKLRLPWFRLTIKRHENRHSRIPTQPSVYIEDLNGFGTYLDDRLVTKPQLVQWGVHIQGSPNGAKNYFQYLFRSNKKDDAPFEVEGKEATYRVFEPFGEGQYSTVWKAVNVDDDKQVYACKDMDKHRRDFNPIELACMKQEVKILKSLKHENIIKFVDEAEVENHIYIFTEYVCGYTLDDIFIRLGNYIDEPTCRKIIKQVCKALCYLHSISIVHRDIKSENIMLDDEENVKLIDFGLARSLSADAPLTTMCGTYAYMAPETAQGEERNAYSTPVDVWGVGVVLFRMVTGQYPFNDGTESFSIAEAHPPLSGQVNVGPEGLNPEEAKHEDIANAAGEESGARPPVPSDDASGADQNTETQHEEVSSHEQQQLDKYYGKEVDYTVDWMQHVDVHGRRTELLKEMLTGFLVLDPSKRMTMRQALQHDWMKLKDAQLEALEEGCNRPSSRIKPGDPENICFSPSTQGWGYLEIVPGSTPSAPRRIHLTKEKTYFGRTLGVDVHLGNDRSICSYQCMIQLEDDSTVTLVDNGVNPTQINNLKLGRGMAGQIFNGDIIGFIVASDDMGGGAGSVRPRDDNQRFLKYRFMTNVAPEIAPAQAPKRRLVARTDQVMLRSCRNLSLDVKTRIKTELESQATARLLSELHLDEWGWLEPLNEQTEEVRLKSRVVTIGRALDSNIFIDNNFISRRHCQLRWEQPSAYLEATCHNRMKVSGHEVKGSMQLREGDRVSLIVSPNEEDDIGFIFHFNEDQMIMGPPAKRMRDA